MLEAFREAGWRSGFLVGTEHAARMLARVDPGEAQDADDRERAQCHADTAAGGGGRFGPGAAVTLRIVAGAVGGAAVVGEQRDLGDFGFCRRAVGLIRGGHRREPYP